MGAQLGEIKRGIELGYATNKKYVWAACDICGKLRWVVFSRSKPVHSYCYQCAVHTEEFRAKQRANNRGYTLSDEARAKISQANIGDKHPRWKGGRFKNFFGYIEVWIDLNDFFYSMATKQNYILEHRLIMAQSLGRCLRRDELVHHLNGIRDDNRRENLVLTSRSSHPKKTLVKQLQNRVRELEQLEILRR